jgi:HEXXH motif-containing protein
MRLNDVPVVRECLAALLELERPRNEPKTHCLFDGTFGPTFENFYCSVFRDEFKANFPHPFDGAKPKNRQKSLQDLSVSMNVLAEIETGLYAELRTYVTDFMIVASSRMHAGSSFRAFGLISLREQRPSDHWTVFLEHIVHEAAHLHLFAVWKRDALVLNPPAERFSSPLRPDPRPMSGIFHAMFVLARITYTYNRFKNNERFMSHAHRWDAAHNSANNHMTPLAKFCETFDTVIKHGKLSPLGHSIAESCFKLAHSQP